MSKHKMFYINENNICKVMLFNILLVLTHKNIQKIVLDYPLNYYLQYIRTQLLYVFI